MSTDSNATDVGTSELKDIHVYPFGTDLSALVSEKNYKHVKVIYYMRHAEGTHNVNHDYRNIVNLDARLTETGKEQCRALAGRIAQAANSENKASADPVLRQLYQSAELIVTSPLTRCMETALLSLEPVLQARPNVPVLAHDGIRETVNFNCDRRRSVDELQKEFAARVDFSHVPLPHHVADPLWKAMEQELGSDAEFTGYRESARIHVVAERARRFLADFVALRPETHIGVCTHRAFSRALWCFGQDERVATTVPQALDRRNVKDKDQPVVRYQDSSLAEALQADYDNCELRSMVLAFR